MIECTDEYIFKKKRHKKLWHFLAVIIVIVIALTAYSNFVVSDTIYNICADYMGSKGIEAINNAVIFSMATEGDYDDIITIEKNVNGDISLISASSIKMNKISREIVSKTNIFMSDIIADGVPIPILAFTGMNMLSGYGRKIYFKTITISKIDCEFDSEFKSVGINQTIHSIYASVTISLTVDYQFKKYVDEVRSEVLLCESVIVGKVPNTYLNGKLF